MRGGVGGGLKGGLKVGVVKAWEGEGGPRDGQVWRVLLKSPFSFAWRWAVLPWDGWRWWFPVPHLVGERIKFPCWATGAMIPGAGASKGMLPKPEVASKSAKKSGYGPGSSKAKWFTGAAEN